MLLSFSVENWMSFRDNTTFSMIASSERQHPDHLARIKKYKTSILPVSAIYGGNASGKTNLIKALSFVKDLVIEGTKPDSLISTQPFLLDQSFLDTPSRFSFNFLIDKVIYEFSFAVTKKIIVEERMVKILTTSETVLYNRNYKKKSLKLDSSFDKNKKNKEFLEFAFKGTRENQLYLTNSVSQNISTFKPIYDWFKEKLILISPTSTFAPYQTLIQKGLFASKVSSLLKTLDTGITELNECEVAIENTPFHYLPKEVFKDLKEGEDISLMDHIAKNRFSASTINGKLVIKKLISKHLKTDGSTIQFEMEHESDGTLRIIDLLPAFLQAMDPDSEVVFFIDELDRSLHSLLTRQLLELYLTVRSKESLSQIVFTTHDLLLMDQEFLRRDEMWIAERDIEGVSSLVALSDYKDIRNDKDIRKSYLQGRFGGIPYLQANAAFNILKENNN